MNKSVTATLCFATLLSAGLCLPKAAHSQNPIYGKGQGYADQMVLDRMYLRRLKAKQKAAKTRSRRPTSKKAVSKKQTGASVSSVQTSAPTRKIAPFSNPSVHIKRDSFQQFHLDDAKGYTVRFSFVPVSGRGKTIEKSFTYNYYDNMADFGSIPAGSYILKAEALYGGKKYPVTLGSESGTPTNPSGGNFASSIRLQIKPDVDAYGYQVLQSSPSELQVRVVE